MFVPLKQTKEPLYSCIYRSHKTPEKREEATRKAKTTDSASFLQKKIHHCSEPVFPTRWGKALQGNISRPGELRSLFQEEGAKGRTNEKMAEKMELSTMVPTSNALLRGKRSEPTVAKKGERSWAWAKGATPVDNGQPPPSVKSLLLTSFSGFFRFMNRPF
jgi:hypothetical protein